MNSNYLLPLFIALPLGAAFLIPIAGYIRKWLADLIAVLTTGLLVLLSFGRIGADTVVYSMGGWKPPFGINLVGDPFAGFFHIIINTIAFLVIIY